MHVSVKDTSKDGKTHILNSVIEADGPFVLCSDKAALSGEVLSVKRTVSGGIEVSVAVRIDEPQANEAEG
jgi:hypothetical protein